MIPWQSKARLHAGPYAGSGKLKVCRSPLPSGIDFISLAGQWSEVSKLSLVNRYRLYKHHLNQRKVLWTVNNNIQFCSLHASCAYKIFFFFNEKQNFPLWKHIMFIFLYLRWIQRIIDIICSAGISRGHIYCQIWVQQILSEHYTECW